MKKTLNLFLALCMSLFGMAAHATTFACQGVVTYLGITGSNEIAVSIGTGPVEIICSMTAQGSYGMSADSCKSSYQILLGSSLAGTYVSISYTNAYSCATMPSWSTSMGATFVSTP